MKFGTSGLRGLVTDLKGRVSSLYPAAFAQYLFKAGLAQSGSVILVGRDFRSSSPSISDTVIGALFRSGLSPVDCGTLPTPALALYGLKIGAASLMVTGSHIPDDRNGIKFYRPDGEIGKADELGISQIATELDQGGAGTIDIRSGTAPNHSGAAEALFVARNQGLLAAGALAGLKIGVYQHSTVARDLLLQVLQGYSAYVIALGRSEEFIPIDTESVSAETIAKLRKWAAEHKLDAIVSADGDGDRPLLADETGEPLRGDLLGLITAQFLSAKVVVTPVTSNSGIEVAGQSGEGVEIVRTKVGSPFVIAGMLEALAAGKSDVMGFEANGGVLTGSAFTISGKVLDPLPTRDSFLPILATLSFAVLKEQALSRVAAGFSLPFAMADRLENFAVEASAVLMTYLRASDANLAAFLAPVGAVLSTSDIDGLRVTLADGRIIHFRPSGNAPEMRCYVEAATQEEAGLLLEQGLQLIRDWASHFDARSTSSDSQDRRPSS
ncbi:phosphomannomutase [Neorhizobium lilium]|uniref:Phosphomannomutase n=1 Tax=Neorhizobium lilium TaxID=2503024 RepID=A0A444LII3_9HYPH|nr:phosphomannomutase [Neorhizobium lilium]RWX78755.1 phosphomannomutase [Neorhizobium lilium]